jgi:hypothetical protein
MNRLGRSTALLLGVACAAYATAGSAADMTKAAPVVTMESTSQTAAYGSVNDFFNTNCPLTWYGITVYGTIDAGITWQSHGGALQRNVRCQPSVPYPEV